MFDALVNGMTQFLNFFYGLTKTMGLPNYGLAIIFMTIVIKMLLYPLSVKQMRSLKITQKLQPKIKEVQERYKKDPQKAQMAVMEIYKQYGANPLSGCLPLLIQMPILIALYQSLYKTTFPQHASFIWIPTLNNPDPFFIMPLLAGLTTYAVSRMTTNMQDQTQKTMLYVMPVFIGFITYKLPSGLGLYWVVSNIVQVIQQYFINKQPLPEIAKEEAATDEGSRKKRKNN